MTERTVSVSRWRSLILLAIGGLNSSCSCADRNCKNPEPVVVGGKDSGFVRCAGGWLHRARSAPLPPLVPRVEAVCPQVSANEPGASCVKDGDCRDGKYGRCVQRCSADGCTACDCEYGGCASDAECAPGSICAPPGAWNALVGTCIAASCITDADCGDRLCASTGESKFACQRGGDECDSQWDCVSRRDRPTVYPSYRVETDWECSIEKERRVCRPRPTEDSS